MTLKIASFAKVIVQALCKSLSLDAQPNDGGSNDQVMMTIKKINTLVVDLPRKFNKEMARF